MVESDNKYADIIDLPHHTSRTRPRMSVSARAAQFAPFAALTGYGAAVDETARLTDDMIMLDENAKAMLDGKLQIIAEHLNDLPEVTFTYFEPDKKKSGGAYRSVTGRVKEIDECERIVKLGDGTKIPIEQIYGIVSELFEE
ncbi:MAG: YolD-like family protein [Ruminococcaceae bacterium]|nr:YolD-like family protein [Oscillospiraceae bacterium]